MKKKNENKKFQSTVIKQTKYVNEDYQKAVSFIIVLGIVLLFLGILFFINGKYVTKDEFQDKTTTTTTAVSYDETIILINNIFNQKDKEYYVILFDTTDKTSVMLYQGLANSYKGETPLYSIDLSNKMNVGAYDKNLKEENKAPNNYKEIKVSGPRLLKIKDGKIIEYIDNKEEITKKLIN